jgi:hypothetical protein
MFIYIDSSRLNNHSIIRLILISLIETTTELSITLEYLRLGHVEPLNKFIFNELDINWKIKMALYSFNYLCYIYTNILFKLYTIFCSNCNGICMCCMFTRNMAEKESNLSNITKTNIKFRHQTENFSAKLKQDFFILTTCSIFRGDFFFFFFFSLVVFFALVIKCL